MPGGQLTPRQDKAVIALMTTPTVAKAAAKAGVGERTLRGWLAEADFLAAYRAARRRALEAAVGQLQRASGKAVRALVKDLDADKAADRIKAACAILDRA